MAAMPSVVAVLVSTKVTVPVGMLTSAGTVATVAVNVTALPNVEGFAEDVTVVVVGTTLVRVTVVAV